MAVSTLPSMHFEMVACRALRGIDRARQAVNGVFEEAVYGVFEEDELFALVLRHSRARRLLHWKAMRRGGASSILPRCSGRSCRRKISLDTAIYDSQNHELYQPLLLDKSVVDVR